MPETPDDIRKWLLTGGYPLEMWAASKMRSEGFLTNQSTYFKDPKTEEYREIDIQAGHIETIERDGRAVGKAQWLVIVECKASREPWIAFVDQSDSLRIGTRIARPVSRLAEMLVHESDRYERLKAFSAEVYAYGIVRKRSEDSPKGAKDLEQRDPAYATTLKLGAAALEEIDEQMPRPTDATFVYPILVLEAQLMAASLTGDGSPEVHEIKSAVVLSPPSKEGRRVSLLVVTKTEFPNAIWRVRQEIQFLRDEARKRLGDLSRDLTKQINSS